MKLAVYDPSITEVRKPRFHTF